MVIPSPSPSPAADMGSKKKKRSKAAAAAAAAATTRGIVGPDYIQLLTGTLSSKAVSIILCGESHEDAIDVTRSNGGKVMEGWISTNVVDLVAEMVGKAGAMYGGSNEIRIRCGICKRKDKILPLGKAREWATGIVDDEIDCIDHGNELALLWVPSRDTGGSKGRSFVVELFLEEMETDDNQHDDNTSNGGSAMKEDKSRANLPTDVVGLLDHMMDICNTLQGAKSLAHAVEEIELPADKVKSTDSAVLLQWADLDSEARSLNLRRLLDEDIATSEHDKLISDRKKKRREEENIWTWDDWLIDVKSTLQQQGNDAPSLQVVLEASIPPWEVELCRDFELDFQPSTAANCIRCLSEDSEESDLDVNDASADGFGSYVDYIYRRLMERQAHDSQSNYLHCVDSRDLGCEHACVAESLHNDWMDLLDPEEKKKLLGSRPDASHAHHRDGRWLPDWEHSPEEMELDRLREAGILKDDGKSESDDEADGEVSLITFPSFEGFFGQNSDILYYSPHCKVAYGPFLGQCVASYEKWHQFFSCLFLGGSVSEALSVIDMSESKRSYLHVRSPIMKAWNGATGEYEWHKRSNEEHDLTFPMLPVKCFLKARGSNPARTWSSHLFALLEQDGSEELRELAVAAREWVLGDIKTHCTDPKHSDDEIGGGEWFLSYLREAFRDIYDDIDHTDPTALLHKKYAAGESCGTLKKHKIGEITIPSCSDGFQRILDEMPRLDTAEGKIVLGREAEVMAKILIDIYVSKLVDFSTALKIAQVISREPKDKVVVICYMGSVHTRAVGDFFCSSKLGFKKKVFAGKQDWGEEEAKILHLPAELWSLNQLFK